MYLVSMILRILSMVRLSPLENNINSCMYTQKCLRMAKAGRFSLLVPGNSCDSTIYSVQKYSHISTNCVTESVSTDRGTEDSLRKLSQ